MTGWVRQAVERYGQLVTVRSGGSETTVRAFLQPVVEAGEGERTSYPSIGWLDGRQWQYLGLAALEAGDVLSWNGETFRVRSCRPYYIGDALSHYWAALEREKGICGS